MRELLSEPLVQGARSGAMNVEGAHALGTAWKQGGGGQGTDGNVNNGPLGFGGFVTLSAYPRLGKPVAR